MIIKDKPYAANNIVLRELSSMCIAKYKESQAFALSELISNPTHEFSTTAREILLVKYDIWFRWLVEVEDVVRRRGPDDDIPGIIMRISDDLEQEYINILSNNEDIFDKEFVTIWLEAHKYMYNYLRAKISSLTTEDLPKFMIDVTDVLIQVMDNTLFELHEIDSLMLGKALFVSFDDICVDYRETMQNDSCLIAERLRVYNRYFSIPTDEIIIKDYSKENLMIQDLAQARVVHKAMQLAGYKIRAII